MTDPTIITPDNLPEIGEMVECVDDNYFNYITLGKRYKVEQFVSTNEEVFIEIENDNLGVCAYPNSRFRRLPENVRDWPLEEALEATKPMTTQELVDFLPTPEQEEAIINKAAESARNFKNAVKPKEPMNELTILVDDELLVNALARLLSENKIVAMCHEARVGDIICINEAKAEYFYDENSKRSFKNPLPLSNWKEVRRRIEELVKTKGKEFILNGKEIAIHVDGKSARIWTSADTNLVLTKQELQTILEQMK